MVRWPSANRTGESRKPASSAFKLGPAVFSDLRATTATSCPATASLTRRISDARSTSNAGPADFLRSAQTDQPSGLTGCAWQSRADFLKRIILHGYWFGDVVENGRDER